MESKTRILGTSRRLFFPTLWHNIASFDGWVIADKGKRRSGVGELNASRVGRKRGRVRKKEWDSDVGVGKRARVPGLYIHVLILGE
jgi:hypothetical protein